MYGVDASINGATRVDASVLHLLLRCACTVFTMQHLVLATFKNPSYRHTEGQIHRYMGQHAFDTCTPRHTCNNNKKNGLAYSKVLIVGDDYGNIFITMYNVHGQTSIHT